MFNRHCPHRWRGFLRAVLAGLTASVLCLDPVLAQPEALADSSVAKGPDPRRLILRLSDLSSLPGVTAQTDAAQRLARISQALDIPGLQLERQLTDMVLVRLPHDLSPAAAQALADQLQRHADIVYAEPERWVRPAYVPNDPQYLTQQWYLHDTFGIRAGEAWDTVRGDANVVVALLDTGILPHADLDPGRLLPGYDFVASTVYSNDGDGWDADPSDPGDAVVADECGSGEPAEDSSWHGLHLAGVVAANTDNGVGIAGISHGSKLLPIRVLGKCGGSFADIIAAIQWAVGLPVSGVATNPTPAKVVNLSFGGLGTCSPAIQNAIDQAVATGAVVVVAAGNDNGQNVADYTPASCNNVITVAGTTRGGVVGNYSNVGNRVSLSAPGGGGIHGIRSIYNTGLTAPADDAYADLQGTSLAAAEVSAVVSLLLSVEPRLTPGDIRNILQNSAQAFMSGACPNGGCGAGILDAAAAVQLAAATAPGSGTSPPTPAPQPTSGGGGGGGGCTVVNPASQPSDPLLPLMGLAALLWVWRSRRRSHQPNQAT